MHACDELTRSFDYFCVHIFSLKTVVENSNKIALTTVHTTYSCNGNQNEAVNSKQFVFKHKTIAIEKQSEIEMKIQKKKNKNKKKKKFIIIVT
jgi:hypothetical protein